MCCECEKGMLPEYILSLASAETKSQFIQRITGAHNRLNLSKHNSLFFIGAKRNPTGKHVTLRCHQRERVLIGAHNYDASRNGQADGQIARNDHVDEHHRTRSDASHWNIEMIPDWPERGEMFFPRMHYFP